jgi:hypothetical protein
MPSHGQLAALGGNMGKGTALHDRLYERAKEAISELYSDKSVSRAKTRESLKALRDEIGLLIETLK